MAAYEILGNPEKKSKFDDQKSRGVFDGDFDDDESGSEDFENVFFGGPLFGPGGLFSRVFRGGGGRSSRRGGAGVCGLWSFDSLILIRIFQKMVLVPCWGLFQDR